MYYNTISKALYYNTLRRTIYTIYTAIIVSQASLSFTGIPRPELPPRSPPESSLKRARADMSTEEPTLPLRKKAKIPPLPESHAYLFTGLHPKYRREIDTEDPDKMYIYCTQPRCQMKPKHQSRHLAGTNNFKPHYLKYHPAIPVSKEQERAMMKAKGDTLIPYFQKDLATQTTNEKFRTLFLEFAVKNNLSFALVEQPETKALFKFLSLNTKMVGRRTLCRDLKARYDEAEKVQYKRLQDHVDLGGRIALTTNR